MSNRIYKYQLRISDILLDLTIAMQKGNFNVSDNTTTVDGFKYSVKVQVETTDYLDRNRITSFNNFYIYDADELPIEIPEAESWVIVDWIAQNILFKLT